jgi:hypothetical protein
MIRHPPVTVEPFQFSSRQVGVAYEWSYFFDYRLEERIRPAGGELPHCKHYLPYCVCGPIPAKKPDSVRKKWKAGRS